MKKKKLFIFLASTLVVLSGVGGGVYYWMQKQQIVRYVGNAEFADSLQVIFGIERDVFDSVPVRLIMVDSGVKFAKELWQEIDFEDSTKGFTYLELNDNSFEVFVEQIREEEKKEEPKKKSIKTVEKKVEKIPKDVLSRENIFKFDAVENGETPVAGKFNKVIKNFRCTFENVDQLSAVFDLEIAFDNPQFIRKIDKFEDNIRAIVQNIFYLTPSDKLRLPYIKEASKKSLKLLFQENLELRFKNFDVKLKK